LLLSSPVTVAGPLRYLTAFRSSDTGYCRISIVEASGIVKVLYRTITPFVSQERGCGAPTEVRQALSDQVSLSLAGKNLLNQVYQSVNGYVMPPLSFWVGAELRL